MVKLIIYVVYLTMIKLTILKMNYGSTSYKKKLIKIKINHN